jgi:hypothetical protein
LRLVRLNGTAIHYGVRAPLAPIGGPTVVFVRGAGGAQEQWRFQLRHLGQVVHGREKELTENVVAHWHAFPEGLRDILSIATHLERMDGNVENLLRRIDMIRRERIAFTD